MRSARWERTLGETLPRIRRYLRQWGGVPPIPRQRRADDLTRLSVRRSPAVSRPACRHGRSRGGSTDRRRRYRGKSPATVGATPTGHWLPTRRHSSGRVARNQASSRPTRSYLLRSPTSWTTTGHRSRSPSGAARVRRLQAMRISHESIYRDLYMPLRKVFDASTSLPSPERASDPTAARKEAFGRSRPDPEDDLHP